MTHENELTLLMTKISSLLSEWRSLYEKLDKPISTGLHEQIEKFLAELHGVALPRKKKHKSKKPKGVGFTSDELSSALQELQNLSSQPASNKEIPLSHSTPVSSRGKKKHRLHELNQTTHENASPPLLGSLNTFDGDDLLKSLNAFAPAPISQPSCPSAEFDLSGLDQVAPQYNMINPAHRAISQPSKLSYDDFFASMNNNVKAARETAVALPPRGDKLIRAFGIKEDMNKKGMQKIKKKSVAIGLKGKGVYQMEDIHYVAFPFDNNENLSVFAVFDGHVDKNAAVKAASLLPQVLSEKIRKTALTNESGPLLTESFLDIDSQLKEFDTEGTTATVVLIWRVNGVSYLQAANVGDSSAFLNRNGKAYSLSKNHKVQDPSERKRMKMAGMKLSKGQNRINGLAVSRVLGDHFIKENYPGVTAEPHISKAYKIRDTDTFCIIASDGLWDTMTGQEAVDLVASMEDPQAMASKLVSKALSSGKCNDNITVIVVLL